MSSVTFGQFLFRSKHSDKTTGKGNQVVAGSRIFKAIQVDIACFCPSISAKTTVLSRTRGQIIIFTDKIIHFVSDLLFLVHEKLSYHPH